MGNCGGKLSAKQREEAKVERYKPVNEGQTNQKSNKQGPTEQGPDNNGISQIKLDPNGTTVKDDDKQEQGNNNSTDTGKQIITTAPLASLDDFNLGNKTKIKKQDGAQREKFKKKIRRKEKKSNEITSGSSNTQEILCGRRENVNRGHGHNPANFGYEFVKGVKMNGGKNKSSINNNSKILPISSEHVQLETEVDGGSFPVSQSEINTHPNEIYQSKVQPNSDMDVKTVMQQTPEAFSEAGSPHESLMYMNAAASHNWEETPVKSRGSLDVEDCKKIDILANNVIIGKNGKIISKRTEHTKKEEHHIFNETAGKGKEKIKAQNVIIGPGAVINEEAKITVDNKQYFHYGNPSSTDICQSTGDNLETASDQTVNTKPIDIATVKAIAKAGDSVGIIRSPRNSGTVFRVGLDKVMTAWHIVKGIIYVHTSKTVEKNEQLVEQKLYQHDVFITFTYETAAQIEGGHYHIERLCYYNEALDIAVLKLKENNNLPPPLTNFVEFKSEYHQEDSFYLIGHPHGNKKQIDFVLKYWEPFGNRLMELNEWSRNTFYMYGYTGMLGYEGVSDKKKIIFNCNFRHGASGAPGIFVLPNEPPAVITVLLRGFPSFYYSENFTDAERRRVPQNKLKQQGVNMGAVQRDLESLHPILAKEIFYSNVTVETATKTKDRMLSENEISALEIKAITKESASKDDLSKYDTEKSHDNKVEKWEKNELEKQSLHYAPSKSEISMPESTDTAELLLTAAKETTSLENKKVKLQRQNATESREDTTRTNSTCPKPLGGTKPYQ